MVAPEFDGVAYVDTHVKAMGVQLRKIAMTVRFAVVKSACSRLNLMV